MALSVTHHVEEGFGILQLTGSLTLGPSLTNLRDAARDVMLAGKLSGLILKVGAVNGVDSAGLGELTIIYNVANRQRMGVRLVDTTAALLKLLQMTRLEELLPLADNIESAKQSLRLEKKV